MAKFKGKVLGLKELASQMRSLASPAAARKVLRAGLTAQTAEARKAIKREAPKDTGALKKAIAGKVIVKSRKADGLIGAKKTYVEGEGTPQERQPARYLHLIQLGHARKGGGSVPANDFMTRGLEASREAGSAAFRVKASAALDKEVRRGTKRTKR